MNPGSLLRLCPPFRAEHIGSLLRPATLLRKRALFERKLCSIDELRTAEDQAIEQAVAFQRNIGLKTITDGEFRRSMFFEGVFENLDGMTVMPKREISAFKAGKYIPHIHLMYMAGVQEAPTIYCTGKIKRTKPFYVNSFNYLKSLVPTEDVKYIKVTMCSPSWFHQRHGSDMTYDRLVYKNDGEYFEDLGVAYRAEIRELYDLGCRHIQIDDPTFCYFCSESTISGMEQAGVDHEALLDMYMGAINVCTRDRPSDLTIGVHMCRGNYKGAYFCEGAYDRIAAKIFNRLDVDTFYLEYDTQRAGDFTPLKHFPLDKVVVLGLVTTKDSKLETIDALKDRVYDAVEALMKGNPARCRDDALNQICISTQCGFASVWEGNPVTEEDQKKKLGLLVEAAKQIWP